MRSFKTFIRIAFTVKPLLLGGLLVAFLCSVSFLAPIITSTDPVAQNLAASLNSPGEKWIFGTDALGRDVFSRVIYGSRISLTVAVSVTSFSLIAGAVLGTMAGYLGGLVDSVIMRVSDVFLSLPALLVAMILMAFLGPGTSNLIIVFIIIYGPVFARLIRGQVISVKSMPYIDAARISGASALGLITKYILPNCISPILAFTAMTIGDFIIAETALSFLGLGVQPPEPSWGLMLADARNYLFSAPWLMIFPGLAVMLTVLGFNLLGDGLGYLLNPKQHKRIGVIHGNTES